MDAMLSIICSLSFPALGPALIIGPGPYPTAASCTRSIHLLCYNEISDLSHHEQLRGGDIPSQRAGACLLRSQSIRAVMFHLPCSSGLFSISIILECIGFHTEVPCRVRRALARNPAQNAVPARRDH